MLVACHLLARKLQIGMPCRFIFGSVAGPTPWKRPMGSSATKADHEELALEAWIVTPLDRGVERIHLDVNDLADGAVHVGARGGKPVLQAGMTPAAQTGDVLFLPT